MVTGLLYCGGPSVALRSWFAPKRLPSDFDFNWPQLAGRTVIGTFRGRTAIALACELLGIGPGDEVLVPSYNCGTEIDAILHSGASIAAYQVSRRCEIELADLIERRTSRTKAIYVIHYFGWEQPLVELKAWCKQQGLLLIEDCALALFSSGPSGLIGQLSDAAIYSLPKSLGVCHGGLLSLPASRVVEIPRMTGLGFQVLAKELRQSTQTTVFTGLDQAGLFGPMLALRRRLRGSGNLREEDESFPEMPAEYNFDPSVDLRRALHPRVSALMAILPWREIVRCRRANYLCLEKAFAEVKEADRLFQSLLERVCPLSFPLIVAQRNASVQALQAMGIAALPWWAGFHCKGIDWSQFSDACWLKRNLLSVPVHQGLDDEHMKYIAETSTQVFRGSALRKEKSA